MTPGMAGFLRNVELTLPHRPTAIVLISAHWQAPRFSVTAGEQPDLIYDYYGFPEHTYQLKYPAKGPPALAQRVSDLLHDAGLEVHQEAERGFDHGIFSTFCGRPKTALNLDLNPYRTTHNVYSGVCF